MITLPIPLFEPYDRFKKLNLQTLDVELPDITGFLAAHDGAADAVASYKAVRLFLSKYSKSNSYRAQRNNIEKLLSWSICIAQKPIIALSQTDLDAFFDFCSDPPQAWISSKSEKRYTRIDGSKHHSLTTYNINSTWRPFISVVTGSYQPCGDPPESQFREHRYTATSVNLLALTCRTFFLFLATEDLIAENPMCEINRSERYVRPREDYERQTVFSALEWNYLNRAIDHLVKQNRRHERTRFIVLSIYHLHLRASDFDKYSRTLKMRDFFHDGDGASWLALSASSEDGQVISVDDEYLNIHVSRYRRYLGTESLPLACDPTPLFASHGGRAGLTPRYVNALFQEVLDVAAGYMEADGYPEDQLIGLKTGSIKWLRHTSAKLKSLSKTALQLNADLRIANAQTTEDRYYKGRNAQAYVHPSERN
jgi:hypothetical protein